MPSSVSSGRGPRREPRYKDTFRGSVEYLDATYLCMVHDLSQEGVHLLCGAAVDVGDRMNLRLQIAQDAEISCLIEVRHVTPDGLGARIIYIGHENAYFLSGRLDKLRSDTAVSDAVRRGMALNR
jgi:hypothetical protein